MLYSTNKKCGAQAADWFPRLTRERNHIAAEVKRLAENADVASIIDLQRLTAILDDWPEHQPPEYSPEEKQLLAIPQALGAAYFIENAMREPIKSRDSFRKDLTFGSASTGL